ncbi:MAG: polyprenyl synthetase family protein [Kofleriaceae bacterium]
MTENAKLGKPPLVAALFHAVGPDGTCTLDPSVPGALWRAALVEPAASFLARPGKDLRARLVRTGWLLGGGDPEASDPEAIARVLELLHAGSLIVDDVEDRSTERRGEPALHVLVGEPLAINTGSWMYFWALAELDRLAIPGALACAVAALVRCHQGQALDLAACVSELAVADVPAVVAATTRLKTGALRRLAVELGAMAAGAPRPEIGEFGEAAGCALQMLDDLGSLVAPARRHKAYEDLKAGRPTWPWAWLAGTCDRIAWDALVREQALDVVAATLGTYVESIGRAAVRAQLDRAIAALAFAPAVLVTAIAAELRRMETLYG